MTTGNGYDRLTKDKLLKQQVVFQGTNVNHVLPCECIMDAIYMDDGDYWELKFSGFCDPYYDSENGKTIGEICKISEVIPSLLRAAASIHDIET